jgi:hypothetical protein
MTMLAGRPGAAPARWTLAWSASSWFWVWALHLGLVAFVAVWLQQRGLWFELVQGDPTGISAGIVVLGAVLSLWCGRRCWSVYRQSLPGSDWQHAWQRDLATHPDQAAALLAERTHGPHETAWWFASAAIKLGLLGTVVGFIVMSAQIGRMPSFDFDQVQTLLKQMTSGMAIALYTTLVGLVVNLWLGLQLLLLDRLADRVSAAVIAGTGSSTTAAEVRDGDAA